jgi:hypothetical protein
MIKAAQSNAKCAAVAVKLKLSWAPAFLNGLGNYVGAFSWGTDWGLGYLDLGQFDYLCETPSACFAVTLIPSEYWKIVGPLDENLPMYYEDSEWCYRARLLGFTINVTPKAVAYHAFSSWVPNEIETRFPIEKLRHVAFGRLYFASKLLGVGYLVQFIGKYLIADCLNMIVAFLSGRFRIISAYLSSWISYYKLLPTILQVRKNIQQRRVISDNELFKLQRNVPLVLMWNGFPMLTIDIISQYYLPWLLSRDYSPAAEFNYANNTQRGKIPPIEKQSILKRALTIWQLEGFDLLLHRVWRRLQRSLDLPNG